MKKVLLTICAAVLLAGAASAQVSYGLKAGVNLAKLNYSASNLTINSDNLTSFHVTGYADAPIAPNFSFQPGLSLQGKGAAFKANEESIFDFDEDAKVNLMYLELPLNFVYYIPTGASGSVFVGAGPYAGVALSGKAKAGSVSEDIEFGSEDGQMKRFDAGANFLLGYRLTNGFLLNAGYGLGLLNTINSGDFDITQKNGVLSFGVGFQF